MWVQIVLITLALSPGASPASSSPAVVGFAEALALADHAPRLMAASASARAFGQAADSLSLVDGVRAELSPGAQFQPFTRLTSPAAQLIVEGTTGAGAWSGSRRDATRADAVVRDHEVEALRLERRLEIGDAWCARRDAELQEATARTALDDARALLDRVERLRQQEAAALIVGADDVHALRGLVAETSLALLDAEALRLDAGLRLGRLLGLGGEVSTAGDLPSLTSVTLLASSSSSSSSSSSAADGPLVQLAEAAVAAARSALTAHEREQWPTVGLGVQAQVDDATAGFAYGRLTVSLPRVDGDARGRAEAVARLQVAEATLLEVQRAWQEQVALAHHEVEHQQHTLELVADSLVPAVRARREIAEKRHALGDGLVFEVVASARAEHEARRRAASARVAVARAEATLALLDPGHLREGPTGVVDDHREHAGHHDDDRVIAPLPSLPATPATESAP